MSGLTARLPIYLSGFGFSKKFYCRASYQQRFMCSTSSKDSSSSSTAPFPLLSDPLTPDCPQLVAAAQVAEKQLAKLAKLTQLCVEGGGLKAQEQYKRKKVLPRERIARLWDDPQSTMLEIGCLAGLSMTYGDIPGAGIVAGIGKIHGRYCLVCANDGPLKGGTYFPIGVRKQLLAAEIAFKCGLPLVILVDSGGGFLPLQAELFPDKNDGGRMFYAEAAYGSAGLPSVAVICGSCTAGGQGACS